MATHLTWSRFHSVVWISGDSQTLVTVLLEPFSLPTPLPYSVLYPLDGSLNIPSGERPSIATPSIGQVTLRSVPWWYQLRSLFKLNITVIIQPSCSYVQLRNIANLQKIVEVDLYTDHLDFYTWFIYSVSISPRPWELHNLFVLLCIDVKNGAHTLCHKVLVRIKYLFSVVY